MDTADVSRPVFHSFSRISSFSPVTGRFLPFHARCDSFSSFFSDSCPLRADFQPLNAIFSFPNGRKRLCAPFLSEFSARKARAATEFILQMPTTAQTIDSAPHPDGSLCRIFSHAAARCAIDPPPPFAYHQASKAVPRKSGTNYSVYGQ